MRVRHFSMFELFGLHGAPFSNLSLHIDLHPRCKTKYYLIWQGGLRELVRTAVISIMIGYTHGLINRLHVDMFLSTVTDCVNAVADWMRSDP